MEVNVNTSIKKENIKTDVSNFNFNDKLSGKQGSYSLSFKKLKLLIIIKLSK